MSNILEAAVEMAEKSVTRAKSIKLEEVLKKIAEHTFSCAVAGGYCRDVFHGVEHKDIDIVVFNVYPDDKAERIMFLKLLHWLMENTEARDITETGGEYSGDRILRVLHLPYHNSDIIFYKAGSIQEVLSKFDCNLNQFYLPSTVPNFEDEIPYNPSLEESPVYAGKHSLTELVFFKSLSDAREDHMIEKHRRFYPEEWEHAYPVKFTKS